eukprot:Opistho-2@85846
MDACFDKMAIDYAGSERPATSCGADVANRADATSVIGEGCATVNRNVTGDAVRLVEVEPRAVCEVDNYELGLRHFHRWYDVKAAKVYFRKAVDCQKLENARLSVAYLYLYRISDGWLDSDSAAAASHLSLASRLGAFEACTKSAEETQDGGGDGIAEFNLGWCHQFGVGTPVDMDAAAHLYRRSAERGLPIAQCNFGACCFRGEGTAKNAHAASFWFDKAAKQGLPRAEIFSGLCYVHGKGERQHVHNAALWFHRAAEQGDATGQWLLGICFEQGIAAPVDFRRAFELFNLSALQGYAPAQYAVGCYYEVGRGIAPDSKAAVSWYNAAAKRGYYPAVRALASCYRHGVGVEISDFDTRMGIAATKYKEAAMGGDGDSMCLYGLMRARGETSGDGAAAASDAVEWFKKAHDAGCATATVNLSLCYKMGFGVEKSEEQAFSFMADAAKRDDQPDAYYELGALYSEGTGTEKSIHKAIEWYKKAIRSGHEKAQDALTVCEQMLGDSYPRELKVERADNAPDDDTDVSIQANFGGDDERGATTSDHVYVTEPAGNGADGVFPDSMLSDDVCPLSDADRESPRRLRGFPLEFRFRSDSDSDSDSSSSDGQTLEFIDIPFQFTSYEEKEIDFLDRMPHVELNPVLPIVMDPSVAVLRSNDDAAASGTLPPQTPVETPVAPKEKAVKSVFDPARAPLRSCMRKRTEARVSVPDATAVTASPDASVVPGVVC